MVSPTSGAPLFALLWRYFLFIYYYFAYFDFHSSLVSFDPLWGFVQTTLRKLTNLLLHVSGISQMGSMLSTLSLSLSLTCHRFFSFEN